MYRALRYLAARRGMTAALVVFYSILIVATHEYVQDVVLGWYERFGRRNVNLAVQIAGAVVILALVRFLYRALRPAGRRNWKLLYLVVSALSVAGSWRWLFYTDAESVHFPQYALLAMLIYPLTRRYGRTVYYATLIGVADECIQFYVAHPTWSVQLDMNDMFYNLIGAGLGCVMVYFAAGTELQRPLRGGAARDMRRSPAFAATVGIVLLVAVLNRAGLMTLDPLADGTKPRFVVRRGGPSARFWHRTTWGKRYHELTPAEAAALAAVFLLFYAGLDLLPVSRPNPLHRLEGAG